MDRVCSLRNIPTRLRGTTFCTSSARFAPSFVRQPYGPKCTQIVRKHTKTSVWGLMGWTRYARCEKFWCDFVVRTFALVRPIFAPIFVTQPNSPKCTKIVRTHQNMNLGSNGVDLVRSLRKIPTRLHGTNFCTSSARFAPSFVSQPNGPQCTKIVQNALKHEFRVQWWKALVWFW